MAVYERSYKGYEGALTPQWSRFLVIPRYAFQRVFASKMFIVFLVLCCVYPVVCAIAIYLPHNLNFLKLISEANPTEMIEAVQEFFFPMWFMRIQGFQAFLMVFFIAPTLISADTRNNGLALYLARPFSRAEYVLGKIAVLVLLLSAITWVPGMLLFFFQSYMMGWSWFLDNLRAGAAIFIGSWLWIVELALLSLAISVTVKWKPVARLGMFALFFFGAVFALMINTIFDTRWGRLLDVRDMMRVVWAGLFGDELFFEFPVAAAWISVAAICAISLILLARRVRAYEVVR